MWYNIAENFQGKNFTKINFTVLEPPAKDFRRNLGVPYPPMIGFRIPQKFSLQNDHSYRSMKAFFLESFPLYSIPIPTRGTQLKIIHSLGIIKLVICTTRLKIYQGLVGKIDGTIFYVWVSRQTSLISSVVIVIVMDTKITKSGDLYT